MKLAIEPRDVDLVVEPHKYTKEDSKRISAIIQHYHKTGKIITLDKLSKIKTIKKELITKP